MKLRRQLDTDILDRGKCQFTCEMWTLTLSLGQNLYEQGVF